MFFFRGLRRGNRPESVQKMDYPTIILNAGTRNLDIEMNGHPFISSGPLFFPIKQWKNNAIKSLIINYIMMT